MRNSQQIADSIRSVMRSLNLLSHERAFAELSELLTESQSVNPPDVDLVKFAAKQMFIATASYNLPFEKLSAAFLNLNEIGFSHESSRLTCLTIFAAQCGKPDCASQGLSALREAKEILEAKREDFGEFIYNQEHQIIESHQRRLTDLLHSASH